MIKQVIAITGFMAAGKTSVARELAERLAAPFIDLDAEIVKRQGCSIVEIINQEGEGHFRRTETAVLRDLLSENPSSVIALGGGTWTIEENRSTLRSAEALVVWLDTPFEVCWQRIEADGAVRPLARSRERTEELYNERRELYRLADERLPFDQAKNAGAYANEIACSLLKRNAHS